MGTSQSKVARIESGDENITIRSLKRLVSALGGRIRFGFEPKEVRLPHVPNWWDVVGTGLDSDCAWTLKAVVTDDDGTQQRAVAGWTTNSNQNATRVTSQHRVELNVANTVIDLFAEHDPDAESAVEVAI